MFSSFSGKEVSSFVKSLLRSSFLQDIPACNPKVTFFPGVSASFAWSGCVLILGIRRAYARPDRDAAGTGGARGRQVSSRASVVVNDGAEIPKTSKYRVGAHVPLLGGGPFPRWHQHRRRRRHKRKIYYLLCYGIILLKKKWFSYDSYKRDSLSVPLMILFKVETSFRFLPYLRRRRERRRRERPESNQSLYKILSNVFFLV